MGPKGMGYSVKICAMCRLSSYKLLIMETYEVLVPTQSFCMSFLRQEGGVGFCQCFREPVLKGCAQQNSFLVSVSVENI